MELSKEGIYVFNYSPRQYFSTLNQDNVCLQEGHKKSMELYNRTNKMHSLSFIFDNNLPTCLE